MVFIISHPPEGAVQGGSGVLTMRGSCGTTTQGSRCGRCAALSSHESCDDTGSAGVCSLRRAVVGEKEKSASCGGAQPAD
jgi:hypothetical protein